MPKIVGIFLIFIWILFLSKLNMV